MTKSTITRERLEQLANFKGAPVTRQEEQELARMALAAMDSEPVAYIDKQWTLVYYVPPMSMGLKIGDKLYRHAQPAQVAYSDFEEFWSAYIHPLAQDDELKDFAWDIWNACRAAMLQELKKSAGTEAICRSEENVQVLHTNSPAQSDCCPAQNHVSPEQNGDTPAQSQGWIPVSEQMPPSRHEVLVGRRWGEKPRWCCKWATYIPGHPDAQSSGWLIPGASWTPTHWMPLPAAPQEVKSES
ncbi:DUF551 domain-containing protein [Klebsiella pneumoniae]